MIFVKLAYSIKVGKKLDLGSILGGQTKENLFENRFQNILFFLHGFVCIFYSILAPFLVPKIIEKSQFFEKMVVRRRPLKHYCFRAAFWKDFDVLGARFWLIFLASETVFKHFATYTGIISS